MVCVCIYIYYFKSEERFSCEIFERHLSYIVVGRMMVFN